MPTLTTHAQTLPTWRWLAARGWTIAPSTAMKGTAACDKATRRILVKPSALTRPSSRVRRYVLAV